MPNVWIWVWFGYLATCGPSSLALYQKLVCQPKLHMAFTTTVCIDRLCQVEEIFYSSALSIFLIWLDVAFKVRWLDSDPKRGRRKKNWSFVLQTYKQLGVFVVKRESGTVKHSQYLETAVLRVVWGQHLSSTSFLGFKRAFQRQSMRSNTFCLQFCVV